MSRRLRSGWVFSHVRSGSSRAAKKRAANCIFPFRRQLRIEPLEDRRLLALVTVNTLNDTVDFNDGVTSLREALFATNLVGGADTIDFAPSLTSGGPATITLTQGELAITDSLTINGPGAHLLTIDASGNDPTPDSIATDGDFSNDGDGSRIFNIDDANSGNLLEVSISGLTLTGGDVAGSGGAIRSQEILSVADSTISGNMAALNDLYTSCRGGGIYDGGSLTVIRSTISNNSAEDGGGAILTMRGNVFITGSTLNGNSSSYRGGAIFTRSSATGSMMIDDSTITGNSTVGFGQGGGGISWQGGGDLTVLASTISGNSAPGSGGGIHIPNANLTVTNSTITGNTAGRDGGGISCGVIATVADSTISGNSAGQDGGGIKQYGGTTTVTASTINDNSASRDGGAIRSLSGSLTVTDATISGNLAGRDGGGVAKSLGITPTMLIGTTISGNSAGRNGGGIWGLSGNLTVTGTTIGGNSATNDGGGLW